MEPHADTDLHIQANICERHWQYLFSHCLLHMDGWSRLSREFFTRGYFSKLASASAPIRQARSSDDYRDRTDLRVDEVVFHWQLHA